MPHGVEKKLKLFVKDDMLIKGFILKICLYFSKNRHIFHHLKLEIALASPASKNIPASNDE